VEGLEARVCPTAALLNELWIHNYGTVDCGAELIRVAWKRLDHRFLVYLQMMQMVVEATGYCTVYRRENYAVDTLRYPGLDHAQLVHW
jgi:hypothetical protein